jgi:hypothetical protein
MSSWSSSGLAEVNDAAKSARRGGSCTSMRRFKKSFTGPYNISLFQKKISEQEKKKKRKLEIKKIGVSKFKKKKPSILFPMQLT